MLELLGYFTVAAANREHLRGRVAIQDANVKEDVELGTIRRVLYSCSGAGT